MTPTREQFKELMAIIKNAQEKRNGGWISHLKTKPYIGPKMEKSTM